MKNQTLKLLAVLILSLMTPLSALAQGYWIAGHAGSVPPDAIVGGKDTDGSPLYICHSKWQEQVYGTQPGKFRADFSGCDFGYAGQEIYAPSFQFLVSRWQTASGGHVPPNAVAGGCEDGEQNFCGTALYYCRAHIDGSLQPGKVRPGLSGCNVPYGGRERVAPYYEVLVALDPALPLTRVPAADGNVRFDAVRGGTDIGGQALYMCSASYRGDVHPGKVRREFGACNIAYEGAEISVPNYTVLVPQWYEASTSDLWSLLFSTGKERNGTPLYTCRDDFGGGIHPGKYRRDLVGCNFGWGGREQHQTKNFDGLTTLTPH